MLGERIKELRKKARDTQQGLADKLGVSQRAIANWEAGEREPGYDVLTTIADIYGVSVDFLLGRNELATLDSDALSEVYFRFAKEAESDQIDPEDIKNALEIIRKFRKPNGG